MLTIAKEYAFSAAHHLPHLAEGHPCARPHGHNYVVRLCIGLNTGTPLPDDGMVLDYGELKPFQDYIDNVLDHRDLNAVLVPATVPYTTAEHLAAYLATEAIRMLLPKLEERFPTIKVGPSGELVPNLPITLSVEVRETPKTSAVYTVAL